MNTADFMKTQFTERTAECDVEELKQFFGDEKPVWKVRGLTGAEIARVNSAIEKNGMLLAVTAAMTAGTEQEKIGPLRELLGISTEEVPTDLIRKKESLVIGSVSPVCTEEMAIKLASTYPTVFFQLTQEIMRLTGLGQDPGKPKPSGKNQESKTA